MHSAANILGMPPHYMYLQRELKYILTFCHITTLAPRPLSPPEYILLVGAHSGPEVGWKYFSTDDNETRQVQSNWVELISNLIGRGNHGCLVSKGIKQICTITVISHFSLSLVQHPGSYNYPQPEHLSICLKVLPEKQ